MACDISSIVYPMFTKEEIDKNLENPLKTIWQKSYNLRESNLKYWFMFFGGGFIYQIMEDEWWIMRFKFYEKKCGFLV